MSKELKKIPRGRVVSLCLEAARKEVENPEVVVRSASVISFCILMRAAFVMLYKQGEE